MNKCNANEIVRGLEGVVVDRTAISNVCGDGQLSYRGLDIHTLVEHPFHAVARWVVTGASSTPEADKAWHHLLAAHCNLTARESDAVLGFPASAHPMRILRALVPVFDEVDVGAGLGEADHGVLIGAKLPAVVLTHLKRRRVDLNPELDYIRRFVDGLEVDATEELVTAINCAQILQIEHSFNAGTFAARVVASTLAGIGASITAGLGALSGELHGGADEAALDMADRAANPEAGRALVRAVLADGGKLPGMGHREYRVRDPRADALEQVIQQMLPGTTEGSELHTRLAILRAMEDEFRSLMLQRGKALHANVDFYKGLIYRQAGLPNHFFTALFAMARVFGYVAHFIESRQDNRIFRPKALYVGV
ncbi:MAG: citrate/2-methylcitrate synthase [Pseudomonadota bacterium]